MTEGRTRRVTLRDAASILGISKDAVRKRVERGTLPSDVGEDGRRYVYLDAGEDADKVDNRNFIDPRDELIQELRREVEEWRQEARRKDHIIAAALERIPAIEPPESPGPSATPREDTGEPPEPTSRRWWEFWR